MSKMKKNLFFLLVLSSFFLLNMNIKAQQSFVCTIDTNIVIDTLGSEMVFTISIHNTSQDSLTAYVKRNEDNEPQGWESSLCFSVCFPSFIDSIVTNSDFQSHPIPSDSTLVFTLHVFADTIHNGTAYVRLRIGNFYNPSDTIGFLFIASTVPVSSVKNNNNFLSGYLLKQNFPNPFNPSTIIKYSLGTEGHVSLKIYDVLGNLISTLVNEYKSAGDYKINFNASNLPSGVYFYRLETKKFQQTKKMILLR